MTIYVAVLLGALGHSAYLGSRIGVSLLAIDEGVPTVLIGVLLSLFSVPPILLALFGGRMIDRVGVRAPLIGAALAMAAALLLGSLVQQTWVLYVLAVFVGLGQNMFGVGLMTAIGSMGQPQDRAANTSWLSLGYSGALFVGPVLSGYLIDWIGQRPTFAVLALFPGAALGLLWRLKEPARGDAAPQRRFSPVQVLELFRHPKMRGALIAGAIVSGGWDVFSFVMPIHGAAIGLSAGAIGTIIGAYGLASASVRAVLPFFLKRMSEWTLVVSAMLASGSLFLVFPFVTGTVLLTLLAFLLGLALGGAQPAAAAVIFQHAPAGRHGEVVGTRSSIMSAMHSALPLVFGALGSAMGMAPLFWIVGGVLLAGGYRTRTYWGKT